ncbi:ABC transporter substrate-binding protein [Marinivivus vitaminiproducens]|uniref:ABC transporter substrate-binding protein n=1 Tax=Marinivivus vitaminiproducens TaxID=3035935 RepID=UPI0027A682E2|nr:ABC transporter substrate-binding protein [Geminicoccaceae bacterium SCSIO 64248]
MPSRAQAETQLRMFWWGTQERARRTFGVNDLFMERNSGVSITGETLSWGDYWPRLATQTAGRNIADIVQMDYRYIVEYAGRGALMPLDDYLGESLQITDFDAGAIDSCRVDGKLYGVNLGQNSTCSVFTRSLLEQAGVSLPGHETTWDTLGEWSLEVVDAVGRPNFWGVQDGGGVEPAFNVWVRQRGRELYNQDGTIGFTEEDITDWFAYWADLREKGAVPRADVQALDRDAPESSMLALNYAAMIFTNSNQLVAHQALNRNKLGMTMVPSGGEGAKPGQYMKPSQMWSIAAGTQAPDVAVSVVNFFVTDPDAANILGVERGVSPLPRVREAIAPNLDELDRAMLEYIDFIKDKVGPLPPVPPRAAGEIDRLLIRVNQQVGFGQLSPSEAGKQFLAESTGILERS